MRQQFPNANTNLEVVETGQAEKGSVGQLGRTALDRRVERVGFPGKEESGHRHP
jgi:hypothetical protein